MKRRMVQEGWRNGGSNLTRHCDPEEIERSNLPSQGSASNSRITSLHFAYLRFS